MYSSQVTIYCKICNKGRTKDKSNSMAEPISEGNDRNIWKEVHILRKSFLPNVIDGHIGSKYIADLLPSKFEQLCHYVGFDEDNMHLLISRIDNLVINMCMHENAAETADGSKLRGTADYWNPQTRSHNTSFIQSTLVACSSANRIQTSFTCVLRCVSPLPSVSVVASDSIHTHPNTEIRRSTSIDYTAVPSRAVRSSGLFCGRADTVERPASHN